MFTGSRNNFIIVLLAAITGYFLYLMIPRLSSDLWNDEIYTLIKFTFVHFKTTLTDYHVPNNHIFYNIFNHFYLKLAGIGNLRVAMENVWVLRAPLLLLSVIILALQYKTGKLAGGQFAGLLSAAILATNMPFQNFCTQVRGYPFSIFFDLLIIYNSLQYVIHQRRNNLVWMILASFLAVYTIPSNLYCVIGVIAFFGVEWLRKTIKERKFDTINFMPVMAAIAGITIALLCYAPVLKQVFTNDYVKGAATAPIVAALPVTGPSISPLTIFYNEIISGQVELYILFLLCSLLYFIVPLSPGQTQTGKIWKLILWQIITPVVMIALRGESPPDRVFVYLSPFIGLLIGATITYVIGLIPAPRLRWAAILGMSVYLVFSCQRERIVVAGIMNNNLKTGQRAQDLRTNYYQHNFHPLAVARYLEQHNSKNEIPVILNSSEPHDIPHFLEAFNIPYHQELSYDKEDSLNCYLLQYKRVYVITMFPHVIQADSLIQHHATVQEVLPPAYHHLLQISIQ